MRDLMYSWKVLSKALNGLIITALVFTSVFYVGYRIIFDNAKISNSATAIGTSLTFPNTNASVNITAVYTTKSQDALIMTGKVSESGTKLPTSAEDYWVVTSTDIGGESIPTYFGRLNTDGDIYVIIPYPDKDKVYTVGIYNTKSRSSVGSASNTTLNFDDKKTESKMISDMHSDLVRNVTNDSQVQTQKQLDVISFNMSLQPSAVKDDKNKVTTLDVDSLVNRKGNTISFDFEEFFNQVYRQPPIDKARADIESIQSQIDEATTKVSEVQETLEKNADDETAQSELDTLNSNLEGLNDQLKTANQALVTAQKYTYKASYFSDYTTKMYRIG